jgi:hypothetical protein
MNEDIISVQGSDAGVLLREPTGLLILFVAISGGYKDGVNTMVCELCVRKKGKRDAMVNRLGIFFPATSIVLHPSCFREVMEDPAKSDVDLWVTPNCILCAKQIPFVAHQMHNELKGGYLNYERYFLGQRRIAFHDECARLAVDFLERAEPIVAAYLL